MHGPGERHAQRPATRRQPPRWLWILQLCVSLASIPIALLGFWQYSRSGETFELIFGISFALMVVAFGINAAFSRHHMRRNTGPWRPGNDWGNGIGQDPAPWI